MELGMPKLDEQQVRAAVSAAKDGRRKQSEALRQADFSERYRRLAVQQTQLGKILAGCPTGAGHDADELARLSAQSQAEMRRLIDKQKATTAKSSASVQQAMQAAAASWRASSERTATLRRDAPRDIPIANFVFLDTAAFIFPTQGINLAKASSAPWNNVARIDGEWNTPYPANGFDDVSFIFAWENPSDRYAIINVASYLMLNGFCAAMSDPGWPTHLSALGLTVELGVLEYWNNPPTAPAAQVSQFSSAGGPRAEGSILGDYETAAITGAYDVSYSSFAIPGKGVAVFVVTLLVGHWTDGGFMQLDFSGGDFNILCPAVILAVLT
jgi:hypothetical protein